MQKWLPWIILCWACWALAEPAVGKTRSLYQDTIPLVDSGRAKPMDSSALQALTDSLGWDKANPLALDSLAGADSLGLAGAKALSKPLVGTASYYSKKFEGRKTTSGETFRHAKMTAASNHFPLQTWIKVTRIKTGKSVVVKVNDRMHPNMKKKGRVVDLTRSAAAQLGILDAGLTKVSVVVVKKPAGGGKKSKR